MGSWTDSTVVTPLRGSEPNVVYRRARRVRVTDLRFGQEAPGFSLPSSAGGQTALSDFKGKSDVVLVFYCYDWGSI